MPLPISCSNYLNQGSACTGGFSNAGKGLLNTCSITLHHIFKTTRVAQKISDHKANWLPRPPPSLPFSLNAGCPPTPKFAWTVHGPVTCARRSGYTRVWFRRMISSNNAGAQFAKHSHDRSVVVLQVGFPLPSLPRPRRQLKKIKTLK